MLKNKIQSIFKIVRIEFYALKSNPQIIYSNLLLPIMYFLFFMLPLNGLISDVTYSGIEMDYKLYVLPGIFTVIYFREMFTCVYRIIIDRRSGLLQYKLNAGIPIFLYIFGMAFIPIIGVIVQIIMLLFLLFLFTGIIFSFPIIVLILIFSILFEIFWCIIGVLIAIITKNYKTRDFILNTLLIPVMYLAPIFSVIDKSPKFIQVLSIINPLTYQANVLRDIIIQSNNYTNLIIALVCTLISVFVASLLVKVPTLTNDGF